MPRSFPRGLAPWPLLLLGLAGCVSPLPYRPARDLVERQGREGVEQELAQVLSRCREPQITHVGFDPMGVTYSFMNPVVTWGFQSLQSQISLGYASVERLDIYENAKVFVYTQGGRELTSLLFSAVAECERFADLYCSLQAAPRERREDWPPSRSRPPAREEPAEEPPARRQRQLLNEGE